MDDATSLDSLGEIRDQLSVEQQQPSEPPLLESTESSLNSAFNQRFGTSGTHAEMNEDEVLQYQNEHESAVVSPVEVNPVSEAPTRAAQQEEHIDEAKSLDNQVTDEEDVVTSSEKVDIAHVQPDNVEGYQSNAFAEEQNEARESDERAEGIVDGEGAAEIMQSANTVADRKSRLRGLTPDDLTNPEDMISSEE